MLSALEEAPPFPLLQRENTDMKNVTDMMEEINQINRRLKPPKARPTAEPTNKTKDTTPIPTLRRSERLRAKRDTFLAKASPVAAFHQCDLHQGFFNSPNPYAGKAAKPNTKPDILTWEEAMRSEYREEFLEAAKKEPEELTAKGTWKEVPKSSTASKVIPCKWIFRIKRTSDGSISKFKGRIVLRGDLMLTNQFTGAWTHYTDTV